MKDETSTTVSNPVERIVSLRSKNKLLNFIVGIMCLLTASMLCMIDPSTPIALLNLLFGALNLHIYKKAT